MSGPRQKPAGSSGACDGGEQGGWRLQKKTGYLNAAAWPSSAAMYRHPYLAERAEILSVDEQVPKRLSEHQGEGNASLTWDWDQTQCWAEVAVVSYGPEM
jgi:hypothetical protein